MPYVIRDEELVFQTYEEAVNTLKTLTIPQFQKLIRRKPFKQKIIKITDSE